MNNQFNSFDSHYGLDLPELKYETDIFPCPEDYLEVVYIDRFLNFSSSSLNDYTNNLEKKHLPTVKVANPDLLGKQLQQYLKIELKKITEKKENEKVIKENSAIIIQSFYRGHIIRRRYKTNNRNPFDSNCYTLIFHEIQKISKQNQNGNNIHSKYNLFAKEKNEMLEVQYKFKKSIIKLQSFFRLKLCQKSMKKYKNVFKIYQNNKPIIKIQSFIRMILSKKYIKNLRKEIQSENIIKIQSTYRGYSLRKLMKRKRKAKKEFDSLLKSVVIIQKHFRAFRIRKLMKNRKMFKVLLLQRFFYSIVKQKRNIKRNKIQTKNAIVIQKNYRMFRCMKLLKKLKKEYEVYIIHNKAAVTIQKYIRNHYAKVLSMKVKSLSIKSSKIIQRNWRGYRVRKIYSSKLKIRMKKKKNAIIIEKIFRGFYHRKKYRLLKQSSNKIVCFYRNKKQFISFNKKCKKRRIYNSAKKIQSLIRMYIQKNKYERLKVEKKSLKIQNSALTIQKVWRGYVGRRVYQRIKEKPIKCAIKIESIWRMYKSKQIVNKMRKESINDLMNSVANLIESDYKEW